MSTSKISLTDDTTPAAVLDVAKSVLEKEGYKWVPTGDSSAEAHEGGEVITKKRSRKLLLGLEVTGADLVLEKRTNGAEGFVVNMGATPAMRTRRHFRKARHSVEEALKSAGLA